MKNTLEMARRTNTVRGLIRIPELDPEVWRDSGEGGLAFFAAWSDAPASVCAVDLQLAVLESSVHLFSKNPIGFNPSQPVDAIAWYAQSVLFIGSTGQSWCNDSGVWVPTYDDLTREGRQIMLALNHIHGEKAELFTVLDT